MLSSQEIKNSYLKRGINQERLSAILRFAGDSILDVGCGNGSYVLELAKQKNIEIKGVDYQYFSTWDLNPNLFSISQATQLGLEDNSVDTILSFETLEHLQSPETALKEFYRVCRKNIIITVPNCQLSSGMKHSKLLYYHWIDRTHANFFDLDNIRKLVEDSGFQVYNSYYINQINLIPFISEAFNFEGVFGRFLLKVLTNRQHRKYYLTCLVVAEKK